MQARLQDRRTCLVCTLKYSQVKLLRRFLVRPLLKDATLYELLRVVNKCGIASR
nr:MAG TPA: Protein of unknown function (DUF448) [Caudoviricetes sp.]